MSEKILLIDGNSILNRAFYGLPLLTDKNGVHTNAVLGFLNIMLKVMDEEKPNYLIVAFDVKTPTFRHEMFHEYKGTRKPMPEELREQLPIIREVLRTMDVEIIEKAGYEADDILGTLAKRYENDMDVTLLSGDRDLLQIATNQIKISIPKTQMGKTETFNYYESDVFQERGYSPLQFVDVKALMGDTADNIPGVPKVGEKTASELIIQYQSLDGVYNNLDKITKKAIKESLETNKELAYLSQTLAKIDINAPIDSDLEEAKVEGLFNERSFEVFRKYSFKSLMNRFNQSQTEVVTAADHHMNYRVIEELTEAEQIFAKVETFPQIGCYFEEECGVAICFSEDESILLRFTGMITFEYIQSRIQAILEKKIAVSTYDIKKSYSLLGDYQDRFNDIMIAEYLIDPLKGDYPISHIAEKYIGIFIENEKDLMQDREKYACLCAYTSLKASKQLDGQLSNTGMMKLYRDIEMPLSFVLFSMEREGVIANKEELKEYGTKLLVRIEELQKDIFQKAGMEFNINSPKQLGEVLFEKLGIPYGKKTKSGYSTAADVLEKCAVEYPIVQEILDYRMLTKLKSTYADGLASVIEEDGRIHTHFNQTITATGRISSTEPNLQNIPIRTDLGRELRKVFVPRSGFVFVDADYSQIELRIMAHMSSDEKLIEAYQNNKDIHRSTASQVFHVPFDEVTDLQRRNAKAVNFGIIYGISSFGLSQDLSISVKEASAYIKEYFESYPKVKAFVDGLVENAKKDGYTTTLFGRVRPIPELKSSNFIQRSFGERVAMNAPIQGTAADIMKIAMIRIFNEMRNEQLESKLIIQVHDEVLIETKAEELDKVLKIVKDGMNQAANLAVALEVDAHYGNNWYEAH